MLPRNNPMRLLLMSDGCVIPLSLLAISFTLSDSQRLEIMRRSSRSRMWPAATNSVAVARSTFPSRRVFSCSQAGFVIADTYLQTMFRKVAVGPRQPRPRTQDRLHIPPIERPSSELLWRDCEFGELQEALITRPRAANKAGSSRIVFNCQFSLSRRLALQNQRSWLNRN